MKILDIELTEFLGMWLNNIRYFKMVFTSRTTVILGRNGSGKSRLMEQLHPFAIQKKDFDDGGGKTVSFISHDVTYRAIIKLVGHAVKCTLINLDTDTVLHKDVNPTYHNLAVEELTGWSLELHSLFCNESNRLTAMRTGDRKYWFGKLSESDLAYALKFHTKLKEDHRDLMGAIKNIRIEIGELALRVSDSAAEFEQIRESMDNLSSLYKRLEEKRAAVQSSAGFDANVTEAQLDEQLDLLAKLSQQVLATDITRVPALEQTDEWEIRHRISVAQTMIDQLLDKLINLKQAIADAEGTDESVDDLIDWIEAAKNEICNIQMDIHFKSVAESTTMYTTDYARLRECYVNTLGEAGTGSRPTNITHEHIQQVKDRITELNGSIYRCEAYIEHADRHLKHYHESDRTECPECKHTFVSGYSPAQVEELNTKRAEATTALAGYNEAREEQRAKLTELLVWHDKLMKLQVEIERLRTINPVDYMILTTDNGQDMAGTLNRLALDWELKAKLNSIVASKAELDTRLARATKYSPAALAEIRDQIEIAETEHSGYLQELRGLQEQLTAKTEYSRTRTQLVEMEQKLNIYYQSAIDKEVSLTLLMEHNDISDEMTRIWKLLEETRSRFVLMDDNRIQLERLRARLTALTLEQETSAALVRAMGPEEGLLAKHLYRSITRVTDLMSAFIKQNWGYSMEVLPCDVEGGELNYRFPYKLADRPKPVADISMSSKGQQKLFDLAYIYTVYVILQLKGFPLFLDEPFNGFDEEHKDKNIKYINNQLERGDHSQLFIISHDPAIHFQLTQADYLVIDANGTSVPKVYNQNVTMY